MDPLIPLDDAELQEILTAEFGAVETEAAASERPELLDAVISGSIAEAAGSMPAETKVSRISVNLGTLYRYEDEMRLIRAAKTILRATGQVL